MQFELRVKFCDERRGNAMKGQTYIQRARAAYDSAPEIPDGMKWVECKKDWTQLKKLSDKTKRKYYFFGKWNKCCHCGYSTEKPRNKMEHYWINCEKNPYVNGKIRTGEKEKQIEKDKQKMLEVEALMNNDSWDYFDNIKRDKLKKLVERRGDYLLASWCNKRKQTFKDFCIEKYKENSGSWNSDSWNPDSRNSEYLNTDISIHVHHTHTAHTTYTITHSAHTAHTTTPIN